MITITEISPDGESSYAPEHFAERFAEICKEHRRNNRALLFAFLLYDFDSPHLISVLEDRNYWNSLNELADDKISIFAFHSPAVEGSLNFASEVNKFAQKFNLNDNVEMPAVLFFQVSDEVILDNCLVTFKGDSPADSFNELKKVVGCVVECVANIAYENRHRNEEIFEAVKSHIAHLENVRGLKKWVKRGLTVLELVALAVGLR